MRRSLPVALVSVVGLLLLLDFAVINPTLATLSDVLLELVVLLAAGAAVAGGIALVQHHVTDLAQRRTDPLGSLVLLAGFAVMSGQTWGRVVAIILAVLSALANFAFIPVYPFWAITIIALDVFIIWALAAHGRDIAR